MIQRLVYALIALLLFQVFFRYSYTTTTRGLVYRIDRLTQKACMLAPRDLCRETPEPSHFSQFKASDFQTPPPKIDPSTIKWNHPATRGGNVSPNNTQQPKIDASKIKWDQLKPQTTPGWDQAKPDTPVSPAQPAAAPQQQSIRTQQPPPGWDDAKAVPIFTTTITIHANESQE